MTDTKYNLESLLYGYYIKYTRLDEMMKLVKLTPITDIYVDVNDMLRKMYELEVYTDKTLVVVSSLLNLAAHLRGYFKTRHGVYARVYLVYGRAITDSHTIYMPEFGANSYRDRLDWTEKNSTVETQLQLLKILCAYIDSVYLVFRDGDFETFAYTNIINNQDKTNIVLTKSKYAYQIPALYENVYLFRPAKYNGEDISYVITHNTAITGYYSKIKDVSTIQDLCKITPELLSAMMTLTGVQSYNVKRVCITSRAAKIILSSISHGRILNCYTIDPEWLYKSLALDGLSKYISDVVFIYRFKAIDLVFQSNLYVSSAESKDITWNIDISDPFTVQRINNQYFIDNPLDLNNL